MNPLLALLSAASILSTHSPARQETAVTSPWPGITIYSKTLVEPNNHMFVAVVDLKNPRIHVRVARGGLDPDGAGQWQTTLMQPTKAAARDRMDFVVNGDFFRIPHDMDAEGSLSPYRERMYAAVIGPAMTDGLAWSSSRKPRPCLVIHRNRTAAIELLTKPTKTDFQVVSGNIELLKNGEVIPRNDSARHPRTAVGLSKKGTKLVIVVVDGRRPGVSEGMTYNELATEMHQLGCYRAINLDGGGSSVMAVRPNPTGKFRILNDPTDGHERPVACMLGVRLDRGPIHKKASVKSKLPTAKKRKKPQPGP